MGDVIGEVIVDVAGEFLLVELSVGEMTAELLFVDVALFNGFPTAISQR